MSKSAFDELSQCILSYHDWLKVDGLWDLLPNYQKTLTDKEINNDINNIIDALIKKYDIKLRK